MLDLFFTKLHYTIISQIYLELQRARLTKLLSSHHEHLSLGAPLTDPNASTEPSLPASLATKDNKPLTLEELEAKEKKEKKKPVTRREHRDLAADLMSEVQVETYSSMDGREKTEL